MSFAMTTWAQIFQVSKFVEVIWCCAFRCSVMHMPAGDVNSAILAFPISVRFNSVINGLWRAHKLLDVLSAYADVLPYCGVGQALRK